ncbi:MAG: peptidoglycan DD-metalloendopeptidase family protein [Polaromonas sp.]|jgi:lipoprotein NlpD
MAALAAAVMLLVGCSSRPLSPAPVEDRGTAAGRPSVVAPVAKGDVKQPPGFENAGKPGYYTVKSGDTLIRIGLDAGQSFRDIARWNNLENPNLIEVGQVLRVMPPTSDNALVVTRPVVSGTANSTAGSTAAAAPARAASAPASNPQPSTTEDDIAWIWPAQGKLIAGFDEVKNKGLDIDGRSGDAIMASADGRVVYAGASLRGYGNLIILKHNNTYLTAYAHNQTLLVREDQTVKKGQKIAEMGNSDADRVKLHFEIRRQGKPVDPAKYLPAR